MNGLDAILANYEDQLDRCFTLTGPIATGLFGMSENDELAEYKDRIDAILARHQALRAQPLDELEERLYRQQCLVAQAGADDDSLRSIARATAAHMRRSA